MNKKVIKNLIAAIILIGLFSLGFFSNNNYGILLATIADGLLITYVHYLINYQKKLNKAKAQKSK